MWNPVLSSDAKCYLNTESILCNPNFVTFYVNNEITKALVLSTLIPNWVYFLSIPVGGNSVLSSDAKISYRANPLEILVIYLVLHGQWDYESISPRNSYSGLGSTFKYSVTAYTVT